MPRKFSQITQSITNLSSSDFIMGVQGGIADTLYTPVQVALGVQTQIIADTAFFVRTDGNDANTGLSSFSSGAWLTLQHAYNVVAATELNGFTATTQIADGTYPGLLMNISNESGTIVFNGNSSNVFITPVSGNSILITGAENLVLSNFVCAGSGSSANETGIWATANNSSITPSIYQTPQITFLNVSYQNLNISLFTRGGIRSAVTGSWSVGGNANFGILTENSVMYLDNSSCTLVSSGAGSPNFAVAFIQADDHSFVTNNSNNSVFTGTATGRRFNVYAGSIIETNQNVTTNLTYFPGDVAGRVFPTACYDLIEGNSAGLTTVSALLPVANLPVGQRMIVSDSTLTFTGSNVGLVVAGTGGNICPVYNDGTNWRIG